MTRPARPAPTAVFTNPASVSAHPADLLWFTIDGAPFVADHLCDSAGRLLRRFAHRPDRRLVSEGRVLEEGDRVWLTNGLALTTVAAPEQPAPEPSPAERLARVGLVTP